MALALSGFLGVASACGADDPQPFFRCAAPVWHAGNARTANEQLFFRGSFSCGDRAKAVLKLASTNPYRVKLNGKFVWYGPARGPKGMLRQDVVPLAVQRGTNTVEIECAGYNCPSFYFQNQPSQLTAEVTVDETVALATADAPFLRSEGIGRDGGPRVPDVFRAFPTGRVRDVPRYSHARMQGEVYEELEPDASRTPLPLSVEPALPLLPRRVPAPTLFEIADDFRPDPSVSGLYVATVNRTGFPILDLACQEPGEVLLEFDEYPVVGSFKPSRSHVKNEIVWRFRTKGRHVVEAFEPYVLRAARITVRRGRFTWKPPRLRLYRNAESRKASFRSSDPELDRLFAAAEETFAQNAVDVFTDCPGRERAGWNCDAFFMSRASRLLTGNVTAETLFLENFARAASFDDIDAGMIPMCYPSDHPNGLYIPSWAMFFVLQLDEYARLRGGDRSLVEALKPRVFALVDFFEKYRNADGLLENLPRWVFVEWSKANEFVKGVNFPNNMIYAAMLEAVDRLYGRSDLRSEARRVRDAIRRQSWTGKWFGDNALRQPDGRLVRSGASSETCQYHAFYFGLAQKGTDPELYRRLMTAFGPARDVAKTYPEIYPSAPFIGHFMRLDWLGREGQTRRECAELKRYFSDMAKRTGTLWENADSADNGSCCHGFASHVAVFIIRDLVGLRAFDPKTRKADLVPPHDVPLDFCELTLPTADGDTVRFGWKRTNDGTITTSGAAETAPCPNLP